MELRFVGKGLNFASKRKNSIILLAAFGFSSYGAYRIYQNRAKIQIFISAFTSLAQAISLSSQSISIISEDLNHFLQSDSDQILNSLKQISKIARSDEFSRPLTRITCAVTLGVLKAYGSELNTNSGFTDRVLDKLFTKSGSGFVSAVVGSFARNFVMAFLSDKSNHFDDFGSEVNSLPNWVLNLICDEKIRDLIGDGVQIFVSIAVSVYLEKTKDVNPYDEIFSGLTNPKHEAEVKDMLVSVCSGAVQTLIRTSHQVLSGNSNPKLRPKVRRGWARKVTSTLAVPSNGKFVLDLTGRVTFETVKTTLQFVTEKAYRGMKKRVDVINGTVMNRSSEMLRYAAVKSSVIATGCLSLCVFVLDGAWVFVPS